MCSSNQQKDVYGEQNKFYQTLQDQYKTVFGDSQEIFKSLTSAFEPILAKGIGQEGFTPQEKGALTSSALDTTGQQYKNVKQALGNTLGAEGGGNEFLPSGVKDQIQGEAATSFGNQAAKELQDITTADYATGRQNYLDAAGVLGGATGVFNPSTGAAGVANQSGAGAAQTANEISQSANSWMGVLGAGLGAAAAAFKK